MESLSLESIWTAFQLAGDSWWVVSGALAVALLLSSFARTRPYAAGFVLPLALLLFRKIALYIPVSGALSTTDQIAFWSLTAWVFFALSLLMHAGLLAAISFASKSETKDDFLAITLGLGFWLSVIQLGSSAGLLPMDWPNHWITPFLTHIVALKLLLIHPLLLPLVGLALALHLYFAVFRQRHTVREANKLLLAALMITGLLQFSMQPWQVGATQSAILAARPGVNFAAETSSFLSDWVGKLNDIERCQVNAVEQPLQSVYQDCKVQEIARSLPSSWRVRASGEWQAGQTAKYQEEYNWPVWARAISEWQVALAAILALVLLVLVGWLYRTRAEGVTPPEQDTHHQPIGNWQEVRLAAGSSAAVLSPWEFFAIMLVGIFISVGLIIAGLYFHNSPALLSGKDSSFLIGLGIAVLAVPWLLAEWKLLVEWWVSGTRETLVQAVVARDRKGHRSPTALARAALNKISNQQEVLNSQPDQFLLTLAVEEKGDYATMAANCLRPGAGRTSSTDTLAAHPACTALTLVDFTVKGEPGAAGFIPRSLWPRAVNRLLRSKRSEARIAATTCQAISRATLVGLCRNDPEAAVWQAAWQRLSAEKLEPEEAFALTKSRHAQVRVNVIETARLPREVLLDLCHGDSADKVREAAWRRLEAGLTPQESDKLSRSRFAAMRRCAVLSGVLSASRLKQLRWRDQDVDVRRQAFARTRNQVTPREARQMARSSHEDVRLEAVQSGQLAEAELNRLYAKDQSAAVQQAAWGQLHKGMPVDEAEAILKASDITLRPAAVLASALPRPRLLDLCGGDLQEEVRKAAWEKLRPELDGAEAEALGQSLYGGVRLWATQSRLLPRARLVKMCSGDTFKAVREEAWKVLQAGLTPTEAETLSRAADADVRLWAVKSDLLALERLRELAQDVNYAVREAARRRLPDSPRRGEGAG